MSEEMEDRQEVTPMPVLEFEGEYVREMEGKLPLITLEMPEGYARGTHLKLEVEVRVRNVRYEEITRGENKGDLVRQHIFALEEVKLVEAFDPNTRPENVGGSASGTADHEEWRNREHVAGCRLDLDHDGECDPYRCVDPDCIYDGSHGHDDGPKMSDCPSPLGTVCKDPACPLHFGMYELPRTGTDVGF